MLFAHSSSGPIALLLVCAMALQQLLARPMMRTSSRRSLASSFALTSLAAAISGGGVGVHGLVPHSARTVIGTCTNCRPRYSGNNNHRHQQRLSMSTASADIIAADDQSPNSARNNPLPSPEDLVGIVFDMDGTITRHCIDFAELRRRIYEIASDDSLDHDGECVLALAERMSPEGKQRAQDVFADIEEKAIRDMAFMDGLADLCRYIDDRGLKRAILTRNVRRSVDALHDKLRMDEDIAGFSPALARDSVCEQGNPIPPKPAPDAILHICSAWGCEPRNVLMVGDSPADDIVAGYRAGCGARVLLAEGGITRDNDTTGSGAPTDDEEIRQRTPCITVGSLLELRDLLHENSNECNQ
jgi:phosphoglycolate phosphatase-like HAD superfamily hydrolase